MNPTSNHSANPRSSSLYPALPGLLLAVLTMLFGFGLGIGFGLNEDLVKSRLKASAAEVTESVYKGDEAAIKAIQDKSWTYMKRAHLHAGSMGTTAMVLTLLLVVLGSGARITRVVSVALGAGGLGYSVFWMWAGFRAPALGSTDLAKESLKWLAMPSSGAFVVATMAVAGVILMAMSRQGNKAA